jgi:hypothetical protein
MTPSEDPTGERTFLHDLSNVVAVAQGHLHLIVMKAKKNPDALKVDDLLKKVDTILASMNKTIELLNARREVVRSRVGAGDKAAS